MASTMQIVLCNCPDMQSANVIAAELLQLRQAACVNILPTMTSMYRWQGKLETATETMLLIKAPLQLFDEICQTICRLHPYSVPEIIAIPVSQGFGPYLRWINQECSPNE